MADRWKEISALYNAAIAHPPDQRAAFLSRACADAALRQEVEALLECHDPAARFMDVPAAQALSSLVADDEGSLVGRQLGSYRLDSLLGAGGMGQVYKATDTRLQRTVAIKILPLPFRGDSQFQQRFEREAQAIAALRHPHICVLHDIGRDGDVQFLVMEYLEGETLAKRLARGPLPADDVLRYAIEIADALVEMHSHGIVHRDLKPPNIMLTRTGAQVLDFGLARLQQSLSPSGANEVHRQERPVGTGDALAITSRAGTLAYMAPEQVRGESVDHRADVFAFGAIVYEMLSGAKAFTGDDRAALAAAVLRQDPPPLPATAPRELDHLVRKCLQKDPADRWQDSESLARALRSIATATTPPATRTWTTRRIAVAAGVLLIAAGLAWRAGSAVRSGPVNGVPSVVEPPLVLHNMRLMTGADRLEISPSLSPDGTAILYSDGVVTQVQAAVRSITGGSVRHVHPERASQNQPRWSPDGTRILYLTLEGVFIAPAAGGPVRKLVARVPLADTRTVVAARASLSAAAWAPDGERIAVADNSDKSLSIVSVASSDRRRIATYEWELHTCDWSPDGRWIACTAGNWQGHFAGLGWSFGNAAASAIVVIDAESGGIREVTDWRSMNQSPAWSRDSRRLYFVSNRAGAFDIYSQEFSREGRQIGEPMRVTTGLGAYSLSIAADRKRLAFAATIARSNLWSLPIPSRGVANVSAAEPLTRANQVIESVRVSRSGRWVVYDSNLNGSFDVYRVPIEGGQPERLTTDPGDEFVPDLAHDDRSLVYHAFRGGSRDLFLKSPDDDAAVQLTDFPGHEAMPAWSPDGQAIAYADFTEERGVFRGAFIIRRDERGRWGPPRALRTGTWKLAWAPNGSSLATSRANAIELLFPDSGGSRAVYTARPNSDDPKAEDVQFSDDGQSLYFKARDEAGRSQIWTVPVSGGEPRLIVEFGDRPSSRTDLAAGLGRFFFTIDERRSNVYIADVTEH